MELVSNVKDFRSSQDLSVGSPVAENGNLLVGAFAIYWGTMVRYGVEH